MVDGGDGVRQSETSGRGSTVGGEGRLPAGQRSNQGTAAGQLRRNAQAEGPIHPEVGKGDACHTI